MSPLASASVVPEKGLGFVHTRWWRQRCSSLVMFVIRTNSRLLYSMDAWRLLPCAINSESHQRIISVSNRFMFPAWLMECHWFISMVTSCDALIFHRWLARSASLPLTDHTVEYMQVWIVRKCFDYSVGCNMNVLVNTICFVIIKFVIIWFR